MVRQRLNVGIVALMAIMGCEKTDSTSGGTGGTGTTTAYVTCASGSLKCPDAAMCTTDAGATECVALPAPCDGKVTCECLGDAVCGSNTCTDGANGAITCNIPTTNECKPGESFPSPDGCNTCTCPASGSKTDAACTTLGCITGPCDGKVCGDSCYPTTAGASGKAAAPMPQGYCNAQFECVIDGTVPACETGDACKPGDTFPSADGCNTCTCGDSGKKADAACTEMACVTDPCKGLECGSSCYPVTPPGGRGGDAAMPMAPAYCDAKGQCVIDMPENLGCATGGNTCVPGETFPAADGCNTCTCPANGNRDQAMCTLMPCVLPDPCKGKACGEACTNCPPGVSCIIAPMTTVCDPKGQCVAGTPDSVGCPVDPNACIPGSQYMADDGCNTCTCADTGMKSDSGCTKIACPPDPTKCIPGESFTAADGCNTCYCPPSGLVAEASCTDMACPLLCTGDAPAFPKPDVSCKLDTDCAIVFHQINCCGTNVAWGISTWGVDAFNASEAICDAEYPKCGCATLQTKSDDGSVGWDASDFVAYCDAGSCKSRGTGCHANNTCPNAMMCLSPGASMGCGICMDPEMMGAASCADDAACQVADPNAICVDSKPSDCFCSPTKVCRPGCLTDDACAEGETCGADKHCAPKACASAMECPMNFDCNTGACARRECTENAACDGFCVNGACFGQAGTCSYPVP